MYMTSEIKDSLLVEKTATIRKWASALEKRGVKIERIGDSRLFTDEHFIYLSNMKRISELHPTLPLDKVSYLAIYNLDEIPDFIPEVLPQDTGEQFVNMEYLKTIEKQLSQAINDIKNGLCEVQEEMLQNDQDAAHRMNHLEKKQKKTDEYINQRDQILMNAVREMQELKKPRKLTLKERWKGVSNPILFPVKGEM